MNSGKIILLSVAFWFLCSCQYSDPLYSSKPNSVDTMVVLECRNVKVLFSVASIVPKSSLFSDTTNWFSEGYFRVQSFGESKYIAYSCGGMIGLPILDRSQKTITDSTNQGRIYSSYSGYNKDSSFWREDHYLSMALTVSYENVPEFEKGKYDSVLISIRERLLER